MKAASVPEKTADRARITKACGLASKATAADIEVSMVRLLAPQHKAGPKILKLKVKARDSGLNR
tara:strand:+ start:632 stop:823 length:192 start_codon:yes stop_codon:yes gene_type:complete